ncbi:histidine ammonia-lyase [Arthrobacter agilis]|uniref:histidine ammonia-lyase n=1 Tax=Arthrobacter agilis TaxID=37921 RepID=UPI000B35AA0E|nr:histidine ammonia-lyase [Arthrobacter agilis]OUM40433.1 histidine ammonia-lyase [Arthrobacter agilis]PPB45048.1 histidine ammonia-lyase [Arthrobacter agilis]TPV27751.1 histidine ammonia-lyase [Arthrobacter agilis]
MARAAPPRESRKIVQQQSVTVGTGALSPADVVAVARDGAPVELHPDALAAMAASRAVIEALVDDGTPHYGVSTGFGALATKHIPLDQRSQLQRSLIRSHAASSGAEVDREVVRGLMLNRLSTLATGRTGVRPVIGTSYAALLNAGITPVIGEYGSLGCSGDLAPLSHVALALMGEGDVRDAHGALVPAAVALAAAGIPPVELREKEGLALINGTDGMLGMLVLASADLHRLLATADLAAAMSVEGLLGTDAVFAEDLHALRPHPGQVASATAIRSLLDGSPLIAEQLTSETGRHRFTRVQDAYSLRCAPQVHGAARATLAHAESVAAIELGAAIDNPVVTPDGRIESNGNFHGAPVGYVLDFLAIAVADVASMSERRTDRFLDKARSHGLNAFLADDPGVDSGHMIAQYTQAGIVSELKRLANPASVDSIPSSAMQEDHVSMGWAAGLKLRRALDGLTRVLAIEILTAARALDMRDGGADGSTNGAVDGAPRAADPAVERGLRSSAPISAVRARLRQDVQGPGTDRYLAPEIEAARVLVDDGSLLRAAGKGLPAALR